jgi:ATP-dependent helicase/nuclease subunit B
MAPINGEDYPALMDVLCDGEVVRFAEDRHPRLAIWGPLEARLQQPDLFILGSLNEGSWPSEVAVDPWMSKAMRESFGLASLDRQTGQAAHDFVQACCAPEVVLTRAMRQDGAPTVRSRWLQRLITMLGDQAVLSRRQDVLAWQAAVDAPKTPARPAAAPRPCPPVAARPRKLSVTQIELWMRDPFALYAKHILKLQPLDPIDADPAAADYGTLTHKALELFVKTFANGLPSDPLGELLKIGRIVFRDIDPQPGLWAFWWPRFEQVARWFVSVEQARRPDIASSQTEVGGSILLPAPGGDFTLTAKVDRIDHFRVGGAAIIDYKTGKPPSWAAVEKGFAPQLSLEAAMLAKGAFRNIAASPAAALEYWHLKGGRDGGKISTNKTNAAALADEALAGLLALVAKFDDPLTAYACQPSPAWAPKYREYDHLARIREWSVASGELE